GRRHAAETGLMRGKKAIASSARLPPGDPLNLIRLIPAEGWFLGRSPRFFHHIAALTAWRAHRLAWNARSLGRGSASNIPARILNRVDRGCAVWAIEFGPGAQRKAQRHVIFIGGPRFYDHGRCLKLVFAIALFCQLLAHRLCAHRPTAHYSGWR